MDLQRAQNSITLQKNIPLHLVEGSSGHNIAYFSYPTLPNIKLPFRLCGCFWTFKYLFEQPHHHGTRVETDACQMYLFLSKNNDNSDIELQMFCDSGSKANLGGWQLTQMKWMSVKVAFINPETKEIYCQKKAEGETRCAKLLCQCRQHKVCLRIPNFCSPEFLQSFFMINKCVKPRHGMSTTYYSSIDVLVTVTFFAQHPKFSNAPNNIANTGHENYWKSQQEASKRIFHGKIGTDFKLVVDGEEFPCHKCILAGHSEVFMRMFSNEQQPSALSSTRLVMENMSVVGVDSFLKYLYYGDTTFSQLSLSVAFELWRAGEKYGIPHLRKTSYEIIHSSSLLLDCGTALDMYQHITSSSGLCGNSSQYSSLKKIALQCFTTKYAELVKSKEFDKLFQERKERAQEILIKIHKHKNHR